MLWVFFNKFQKKESLYQVPSEMTPLPDWETMSRYSCGISWQPPHQRDMRVCFCDDAGFTGGCANEET